MTITTTIDVGTTGTGGTAIAARTIGGRTAGGIGGGTTINTEKRTGDRPASTMTKNGTTSADATAAMKGKRGLQRWATWKGRLQNDKSDLPFSL